jgi:hypothetical protein
MNKIITLLAFLLFAGMAAAQLPSGATAPNFTAKDLNGRTWNLYDILETGRPVVIDIFATWCGPCWNYHSSGALDEFYALHGPEGDAQTMVFMIEGDGSTNIACLSGSAGCNSTTQGDWVTGTPYPILDNAAIFTAYKCTYYPTIFRICTDKTVEEVGQVSADALWAQAEPCVNQVPVNYAKITQLDAGSRTLEMCGPQSAKPVIQLANMGTAPIQTMEVALRWNGDVIQTKTFTGNAAVFELESITFDPITVPGPGMLTADVLTVNGQPNGLTTGSKSVTFTAAPEVVGSQQIVLYLKNDPSQAVDTWWGLYDDNGNLLYHGGNELVGPTGAGAFPNGAPADPSAYANNVLLKDTLTVPDCFNFQVVDARGNGLTPPGYYKLFDLGNPTPFYTRVGNWGKEERHAYSRKVTAVHELQSLTNISLFPNPASEQVTASFTMNKSSQLSACVTNATGQIVWRQAAYSAVTGENTLTVPTTQLSNGLYYLSLQSAEGIITKRFAVAR